MEMNSEILKKDSTIENLKKSLEKFIFNEEHYR